MQNLFNEDYYERGIELNISGYSNYRWIPELTIPLAFRMIEYLGILKYETILDFGCAKGYLVNAFRLLYREAYGYDISEYAISSCHNEVKDYLYNDITGKYFDWVICKDVLEHISYEEINHVIRQMLSVGDGFFVIVPLGENGKYVIPSYNNDMTHIIKEPMTWWENLFIDAGFNIIEKSYTVENIKQNYASWEKGNAFFVLERPLNV